VIDDRMWDEPPAVITREQVARAARLAYRRQRRQRILRDTDLLAGVTAVVALDWLFGLPVWYPCVLLFVLSVIFSLADRRPR
jgi:hypothetical protein